MNRPASEHDERTRLLAALRRFGRDAVCFQALESGVRTFVDGERVVSYVDTGSAWLAIGRPLAPPSEVAEVAARFVQEARRRGRRVSFVGVEDRSVLPAARGLLLGEQAIYSPAAWPAVLAAKKSLREQLRRAKAKGVRVRRVASSELTAGSPLRERVRELATRWLASRRIEPLQFLVALEPFHAPDEHRYFVAERAGEVIAFASAIPIPARNAFMLEDVVRDFHVPNGTTELLVDAVMHDVAEASMLTLGLAPFSGEVSPWLALLRHATRPLFDFTGLRAFKERLHPVGWEKVYLLVPAGESAALHVLECLRAFAGGSLVRFGVLSLIRHESGPPWALVIPLVLWIVARLTAAFTGQAFRFAASAPVIVAWSLLDIALAALLFRAALRPRARRLAVATAVAAMVAMRSASHVAEAGLGHHPLDALLRLLMVIAPTFGTLALAWATHRRRALDRGERRTLVLPYL